MSTKSVAFEAEAVGYHTHHWVVRKYTTYLSLQTKKNEIKMFSVDQKNKSFKEEDAFLISVEGSINYSEFDSTFEHIFILKDSQVLEKRSLDAVNTMRMKIKLKEPASDSYSKQLVLSNNGTACAIGGGGSKNYFFLIDLESSAQHKLTSDALSSTYAPCFINGNTEFVAVSGSWR